MRITIFTGSSIRHKFLINSLTNHHLSIILEDKNNFGYLKSKFYNNSSIEDKYFKKVKEKEIKIFGKIYLKKKKISKIKHVKYKKLNSLSKKQLKPFLNSELFIVFGSSFIKNDLVKFLYKKKCLNIHMGISPYYRGSNCNFWAILDKNYHLVGSTIHRLTDNIDAGPILYHSLVEQMSCPIEYSMASVKSAILSLKDKIDDKTIFTMKENEQNLNKQIRFSKNSDITFEKFKTYPKKIKFKKFNYKMLTNPVLIKKSRIYG